MLYGESKDLFAHVGFYLYNFGAAEFHVTILLWIFIGFQEPQAFFLLTKGMDAKAKIVRLKEAVALRGWTIGPNLKARLSHLSEAQANLRNRISHNYLDWKKDALEISNFSALPTMPDLQIGPAPETIPSMSFFERGCWLNRLAVDFIDLTNTLPKFGEPFPPGILEIENPRSGVPTGAH